jgi:DNA polymerase IV (DinB-like DNA polymerase)
LSREQYEGRLITEIFNSATESGLLDIQRQVWSTGQAVVEEEFPYPSGKGVYSSGAWLELQITRVDEGVAVAWRDVTEQVEGSFEKARDYAQKIKADVKAQVGISFTIGVGPNKLVAKIACDSQKPDGLTIVKPEEAQAFLAPLAVDRLLGVGKKTTVRMEQMGIKTISELARYDTQRLIEVFGKVLGIYFHNAANAVDNEPVQEQGEAESISKINTLKQDTHDLEYIMQKCDELTEIVYREVAEKGYSFKTVSIYMVNVDLSGKTRSVTLEQPAKDKETIRRNVRSLFERYLAESPLDIRRVGVRVAGFSKEEPKQKSLTSFFGN